MNIYISNLNFATKNDSLQNLFAALSSLQSVPIISYSPERAFMTFIPVVLPEPAINILEFLTLWQFIFRFGKYYHPFLTSSTMRIRSSGVTHQPQGI